ncbi:GNAT family N-acetyltransferase [Paenibacillus sp. FSL H8-0259]|uniref:GNAT family N-acetyltransferase n=1 Tax=Paenibacillus sp. FSL H8-0259 TaxID=1920423 RepID=UPI00096E2992|nr:GNAT family N-acetyltransferase [Paenibacillus sp. FSL H8-0259]OMF32812.1 spermidine acetyltransferase [Paenibacillus sp. FSL H8-0259]
MSVELKPVSSENWYECTQLTVKPEQLNVFPAPVVYWIAESKYVDEFELRAIYSEEVPVGFLVFCTRPDKDDNYWIPALMVDHKHQGKGYGKAAMETLIQLMSDSKCTRIMIGHRPDNLIAGKLYESLGFSQAGEEVIDGEIVRLLQISELAPPAAYLDK